MMKSNRFRFVPWYLAVLAIVCACKGGAIIEDHSAFAATAGQATMVLGGEMAVGGFCQRPLSIGYDSCFIERGSQLPTLRLVFVNPAEWMVSDCGGGVFKSGSQSEPGEVTIDISPLSQAFNRDHLCIIDVEANEYYPDPKDRKQRHAVPLIGGFYLQGIEPGYLPTPEPAAISWCYTVKRTNKGRTILEACK